MTSPSQKQALYKAIILVGGPSRATRFRPLSLDVPKPLFPVAGAPLIHHHLQALSKVHGLREVLIVGFFEDTVFNKFIEEASTEFPHIHIKYLREYQAMGTAGGIYHFRDEILHGNPQQFFVMHVDIACSFPLNEMVAFHMKHRGLCTMLSKKIGHEQAKKYGCLVADQNTNQVLHYVEKPDTFVSDLISCGVYLFDAAVFTEIKKAMDAKKDSDEENDHYFLFGNSAHPSITTPGLPSNGNDGRLSLERDLLRPLSESRKLYAYVTEGFWKQIKTAGSAVAASAAYLELQYHAESNRLARTEDNGPEIIGAVYIHPTAQVDSTAKHASCILHSVIGWNSKIGAWARVEGTAVSDHNEEMMKNGVKLQNITILGKEVSVLDETIIRNCIVLPHKELKSSYHSEILM
ncbi:nucleotide-diphospho-sugar transferase [Mycotypha africana]|uniref:nucleotide-diphospho-sugar transferase n=1 Tax=Mycotypha africana TaxID=64632 RepID=UPI00230141DD|nr:nucleotide-diphospho-sugar transferase [Mycotypha africana]KAI8992147.1 nucleotide-diphospho-sugar transferase [Mycotypha africana]